MIHRLQKREADLAALKKSLEEASADKLRFRERISELEQMSPALSPSKRATEECPSSDPTDLKIAELKKIRKVEEIKRGAAKVTGSDLSSLGVKPSFYRFLLRQLFMNVYQKKVLCMFYIGWFSLRWPLAVASIICKTWCYLFCRCGTVLLSSIWFKSFMTSHQCKSFLIRSLRSPREENNQVWDQDFFSLPSWNSFTKFAYFF